MPADTTLSRLRIIVDANDCAIHEAVHTVADRHDLRDHDADVTIGDHQWVVYDLPRAALSDLYIICPWLA